MRDLALNPATGDLAIATGRLRLTDVGAESVRQRLQLRLSLWRGEYVLDRAVGIPYLQRILGKGTTVAAETILRRAVATSPGVRSLDGWSFRVGSDRRATIACAVRCDDGSSFDLSGFTVGSRV